MSRPLRITHVLAERGYSGGEQQLEHLVRHLHARGHQNTLVLVPGSRFAESVADLGLSERIADLRRPWNPAELARARRAVRDSRPEVLHFGCGRSLLWGGLAAVGLDARLRVTTRRIDYPIGRAPWRAMRYRKLVDHVVANCESVRRRVLEAGVPPARVTLVHEGIDVEPWRDVARDREAARARLDVPADAVVVSCAASLRPRKGQSVLIDAFARLAGDAPQARLILAGDGTDRERLRADARARGLEARISIPGSIQPVADLYAASDVFVMPSYHEGLSNACLEASAAGLPLVVSGVGGLPEIVEAGVTGDVVPPGDAGALHASLARYVADAELRRTAGLAGQRRTSSLFTARIMAENMEALFERLIGGPAAHS